MKKKNSYQKLKDANKMLAEEINILVFKPDSVAAAMIRTRCVMQRRIENAIMAGHHNPPNH